MISFDFKTTKTIRYSLMLGLFNSGMETDKTCFHPLVILAKIVLKGRRL